MYLELTESNIKTLVMVLNDKINNLSNDEEYKDDLSSIRMDLIDAILK